MSEPPSNDGAYLELGQGGRTETVVRTSSGLDKSIPPAGLNQDGQIVQTVNVDVSEAKRGGGM